MIISASRRTDIPAFYAEWFMNRIQAGYCSVPNPFNRKQVSKVSLIRSDVDVIVFWTRNPRPIFPFLEELDRLGYFYYFQFTIVNYPREIDPKSPPVDTSIRTFRELSERVRPERIIWRYDPIVLSDQTDTVYHIDTYKKIAELLSGYTHRSVISIMDFYSKANSRLNSLNQHGYHIYSSYQVNDVLYQLIPTLVSIAKQRGMEIFSCAEEIDLTNFGVSPGKCIDDDYIRKVFGIDVTKKKDPSQRKECGCVVSKDIGMYDSCLFGCQYCYATNSFPLAHRHHAEHNPASPSLIGWYEPTSSDAQNSKSRKKSGQLNLFENE